MQLADQHEYIIFTESGVRTGRFDLWNQCFWLTDCTHPLQNTFLPLSAALQTIPYRECNLTVS